MENVSTCVVEEADIKDFGVLLSSENDGKELSIIFITHPAHLFVKSALSHSFILVVVGEFSYHKIPVEQAGVNGSFLGCL